MTKTCEPIAPDTTGMKMTTNGYWIHGNAEELPNLSQGPFLNQGPFVRLSDGRLLTVRDNCACVSPDDGKTWTRHRIFADDGPVVAGMAGALIQTRGGAVIMAFINIREKANWNWREDILDSPGAILPTYVIRSLDGGKTWQDLQKLHDEWTGAIRDIIETRDGSVVFTSMMMRHAPGRHAVVTYTSNDDGQRWTRSSVIDLGGIGHHGGVTESTLEQLADGRIWMLLRTNWGRFWETFSDDEGRTWKGFKPTRIDASSAPGFLCRLRSGRLALVWNRYFPEGKTEYPLQGGDGNWSEVPVSNHREELSLMFSNDEGNNWSGPVVIARISKPGHQLSYPLIFEAAPGELWITTTFAGELSIRLFERDFV